jgi:adenine-specific DNA-methyltransferase
MMLHEELLSARTLAASIDTDDRLGFARGIVCASISSYWRELQTRSAHGWALCAPPGDLDIGSLSGAGKELALAIGRSAARLDVMDASYTIGLLYTGVMPEKLRAKLGAYYTPPALCERLLDMATDAGVDWGSACVLDPACGGGAFLSPVARRMAEHRRGRSASEALKDIVRRLHGFEIDPFAAWMSQVFLEVTLADLCRAAGTRLPSMVRICHSLEQTPDGESFDLVVGNPPYGRTTLSPELRAVYRRSLFGHANLYGLFTDLALRYSRMGGVIAYVTPTSFLAGEYFKALRGLLARDAPPASIAFVEKRSKVFADVLQETMLATYRRGGKPDEGRVDFISTESDGSIKTTAAGSFRLPASPDRPWMIPRTEVQSEVVRRVHALPSRLADYGYQVSTGPLVWNRHKPSMRDSPGPGRFPLVWAESVRSEGVFEFRAQRRNHKPYFEPNVEEFWVVTDVPCVLLQRTTAKEQDRRLIAAELPASFIHEHGAVVIENHLNMIRPVADTPRVTPAAVAALLNSAVVDRLFRCINGSVAVSAYELESLPLPRPEAMERVERLVQQQAKRQTLEHAVESLYGNGA